MQRSQGFKIASLVLVAGLAGMIAGSSSPACARDILHAPSVIQPEKNGDVVGFMVRPDRSTGQIGGPLTFGQVFASGLVPAKMSLAARIGDQQIPVQVDRKAVYPDGSLRMGILSLDIPPAKRKGFLSVMLVLQPAAAEAPLPLVAPGVSVEIVMSGGQKYQLDPAGLIQRAVASGKADYWLHGPQASEARFDIPLVSSLHISFDVRSYAGGASLTDITFRNDYAFRPVGGPLRYGVTIRQRGATVFSQAVVDHPQYTHWHKAIWSAGANRMSVIHDIAFVERSGAILDYDLKKGVSDAVIENNASLMTGPEFEILGSAGVTKYMPMTGGRGDIGPVTLANTLWLLSQDPRAEDVALAQADAAGSIPWHFFDGTIGHYRTATQFPRLWLDGRAGPGNNTIGLTQYSPGWTPSCGCWQADDAHQPDLSFVPYIMTGSRYYLDQLEAQTSWGVLAQNPDYRLAERGIVVYPGTQVRSMAWNLRNIANAAWIVPDGDPLKKYFVALQDQNLGYLLKEIASLKQGEAAGWISGVYGSDDGAIAPWQQDFLASATLLAAKRGVPAAQKVLEWQAGFLVGRFLAEDRGFHAYDGVAYNLYTWAPPSPISNPLRTWALIGAVTAAHNMSGGGRGWPAGAIGGYVQIARGMLAGIARQTGSAEARKAYAWVAQHAPEIVKPQDDLNDPTWNIAPP